jgi:NlpC/P60 family putative phage cell wall peptidase
MAEDKLYHGALAVRVVAAARGWLGTPYHHQAARKGAGCDCLGLVRGVYVEVTGRVAETPPPYTRDWAEMRSEETLLHAAAHHLRPLTGERPMPGDVLIFRMRAAAIAKHAGIMSTPRHMIHATEGDGVVEVSLGPWWWRHLAGAFRF